MTWTPGPRLARIGAAVAEAEQDGGPFGPDTLLALDDQEAFPAAAAELLDGLGAHRLYVDRADGGELDDLFDLTGLVRLLARRDLTVAVAHAKTFLGAASVWIAGEPAQRHHLAERIGGGAVVSWGLTERGRGGDLLAGGLGAAQADEGWRLTGEKWLINNASRGDIVSVLARTRPEGGPRGFSLFLVDKAGTDARSWQATPKVPTHGIRGADISGIAFAGTLVPDDALVGALGSGIETTLKALQLTRTMCCGLSLGALDHALALGGEFVRERRLYSRILADLPHVQQVMGRCVAALNTAEALSLAAARIAGNAPEDLPLLAAAAKALVPELCQEAISALGELLGVRGYLAADEPYRAFQKIDRDHRIVGIFDGSTAVCRNLTIDHFPMLARTGPAGVTRPGLLDRPPRPWDPERLRVLARSCALASTLAQSAAALNEQAAAGDVPDAVAALAAAALRALEQVFPRMAAVERGPRQVPQEGFDLARDFELCLAAAAVCRLWLDGAGAPGSPLWADGLWLTAALTLIVERLPGPAPVDMAYREIFGPLGRLALADDAPEALSIFDRGNG